MAIIPELLSTEDGSHTLIHPVLGDTYHSTRGAVGESEHVFIQAGFDFIDKPHIRIFEMGFGSGLNALQTLRRAHETEKTVNYHAVELYPIDPQSIQNLNYVTPDDLFYEAFLKMHASPWGREVEVDSNFSLKKEACSLMDVCFEAGFDVIYFDAFAPETQPELWTEEVFRKLYQHTVPGGILVTYSAKGDVKKALRAAGYEVKRLPGALGKRHMLRAQKNRID